MHLVIPFAACDDPAARQTLHGLRLPYLEQVLQRLTPGPLERSHEDDPALPHERALAAALGLPASAPWAARRARQLGLAAANDAAAWAFITPCHWEVGQSRVTLHDPQALALNDEASRALLAAMQPYFTEDGLALHYERADRWLASGAPFEELPAASPERAIGRDISPWMPAQPQLRRLQNEMQMLLYTHPVNAARSQRGQLPVNSFWISGAGAWPGGAEADRPQPLLPLTLRDAALHADWPAWRAAWQAIDARECAALRAALDAGADVRLTLCSEAQAQTWTRAPQSLLRRLGRRLRRVAVSEILEPLCN